MDLKQNKSPGTEMSMLNQSRRMTAVNCCGILSSKQIDL